jgi:transposase
MTKPVSLEIRQRILDDCNTGMRTSAAAKEHEVSASFITQLKRHFRETGSLEPKKQGRTKPGPIPKLRRPNDYRRIAAIVRKNPKATLKEIREQLSVKVCNQTVAVALREMGLDKKTLRSAKQSRPDAVQK